MKKYLYIEDGKIIGKGELQCLNDSYLNIEVNENIYNNFEKYIYENGDIIFNPEYQNFKNQKERTELDKLSLTKREIFLILYKEKGITPEEIKEKIKELKNKEALIEFEYATNYTRGNPLINKIGILFGFSEEELDYLFENKKILKGSEK